MQSNLFRICFYVFVSCVSFVVTITGNKSKNIKFMKERDLNGFSCPDTHIIFSKDNLSISQCFAQCADSSGCFGVFRHQGSLRCVGCKDKFLTRDKAPIFQGTTFYRRRSYLVVNEKKNWADSKNHCSELGGQLVDIKSSEENSFIGKLTDRMVWIGASDIENEGVFVWADGFKVTDYFENWNNDEPSNTGGWEHCVYMANTKVWNDNSCSNTFSSVCEFD